MRSLRSFVLLARPHFLLGGALMYLVGLVSVDGPIDQAPRAWLALGMVLAVQLTAHFVNEYFDRFSDAGVGRRTLFSGGSGMIPSGAVTATASQRAALLTSILAVGLVVVVSSWSAPASALGAGGLAVAWLYSAPPARLAASGWGELAVTVVVTVMVPLTAVVAQGDGPGGALLAAMGVLALIHFAMLLAFELPDLETDAAAGKRVLAVRWGPDVAILAIRVLYVSATVAALVIDSLGTLDDGLLIALGALPGMAATGLLARSRNYFWLTAFAVLALVGAGIAAVPALA